MLKELGVILDEPKTLTEVKLRQVYNSLVGRDPDLDGMVYWANLIDTGALTIADLVANAAIFTEVQQYREQANGNPVSVLVRRDNDGNIEAMEAAFNSQFDRANLGYQVTGDIISLPYEHEIYIQNKLASSNVNINPYGVSSFIGTMTLNPPDNSIQPKVTSTPQIQNDPNDNYTTIVNSFKQEIASKEGKIVSKDDDSGFYGSYYGEWELLSQGAQELDPADNTFKRVDTYVRYRTDFSIKPTLQTSTRAGQRRDILYDENVKPKMSDVRINFSARGMKPNTRVHAFFGDRNVTSYCIAYSYFPDGRPRVTDQLMTNDKGEINGTFTYSENDLNFDAGLYIFALSDSIRNNNNRETYAAASFNGLGLSGYAEDTFRTRLGELTVNKTSTVTVSDPRTVIVGEGPVVTPPVSTGPTVGIDMIEICFVYGFGRRPTAEEKAAIYDKWVSYGVSSMTTWNAIVMTNPSNGANTNGNELFREYGFLRVDPVLHYVDRAITVVPDGTDSADLRSKYLAAATYDYGKYSYYFLKDQPIFPATINYTQFLNLDPTQSLTPPWTTDLNYSSMNAEGLKCFDAIYNFFFDVWALIGGWKTAQDYQGELGFNARFYNFVQYAADGSASLGTPKMPAQYAYPRDVSDLSNLHVITTVWNSVLPNDCMQPYRVSLTPDTGPPAAQKMIISICPTQYDFATPPSYITVDKTTGNITGSNGGAGSGPGAIQDFNIAPINTTIGGGNPQPWSPYSGSGGTNIGVVTGNRTLPGQPYTFIGTHYGNHTFQILFGVTQGQTANTLNVPIRIVCYDTGASYDTWIPGSANAYWDNGSEQTNFVDVYTGYKGGDPLGVVPLNNAKSCYRFDIHVRNDVAATVPPLNGGYGGTGGGCPDPDMLINVTGNTYVRAGDLEVGQKIWTVHETTNEPGLYTITRKEIVEQPKMVISFAGLGQSIIVSESHRFKTGDTWTYAKHLKPGMPVNLVGQEKDFSDTMVTVMDMKYHGMGPVVKLEIDEAHTYLVHGLVSHNTKVLIQPEGDSFFYYVTQEEYNRLYGEKYTTA